MAEVATVEEQFAQVRAELEEEYSSLLQRHGKADEANNRAYDEQDGDNPEPPPFETERSASLLQRMADVRTEMDRIRDPAEYDVTAFEQKVRRLASEAQDISLG